MSKGPQSLSPFLAFHRKAGSYHAHSQVQRDTADWVAEWLPAAGDFESCLEFGSGTGNFTRHLVSRFARVEASDQSRAMIAEGSHDFPSIVWSQQDAWNPADSSGGRDFVASCSLLQWASDPLAVLTRWRGVLRPGGRQLSGIYIEPSLPEFGALLPEHRPFPWRTADEWREAFAMAGFADIRLETRTKEYLYPSALALLRQLHETGATVLNEPLPAARLRRLLRDYEQTFGRAGGVPATWTYCRIVGTA